jgi:hypothetical protein
MVYAIVDDTIEVQGYLDSRAARIEQDRRGRRCAPLRLPCARWVNASTAIYQCQATSTPRIFSVSRGMKPLDALRAGRIDRVEAALTALDSDFVA